MEKLFKNSYEWLLGWRYTRSSRGSHKSGLISLISALSIVGIALSVAALIIVLSVMNGFQREVRGKMLSVIPHIQVYPAPEVAAQTGWEAGLTEKIRQNKEVMGVSPYMSSQAIILSNDELIGVKTEGVEPATEKEVSEVPSKLVAGKLEDLKDGEFNVIIGLELANRLGIALGNDQYDLGKSITLMAPEANTTPAGVVPRMREFKVVGVIASGHYEIDNNFIYINVNDAKRLFHNGNAGLRVKVKNMDEAADVGRWIEENSSAPVFAQDWSSMNPSWFSAVKTEKIMISIILLLITTVAIFNLVSMLSMTVNEKLADIAILRTLGASKRSVNRVFMIQGALIGGAGTFFGVFFGVLVALNVGSIVAGLEKLFQTDFLPKGVYFISRMPSEVRLNEVLLIAGVTFGLSLIATIYPSQKAAAVEPAKALRYE